MLQCVFKAIRHQKWAILHPKIVDLPTKMADRAQGSTMMGPGLKVALWHWLIGLKVNCSRKFAKKRYRA